MIRAIVMASMICFGAINTATAETVEIPLTGLVGTYSSDTPQCISMRSASFQLDRIPEIVYAVSIRISGTGLAGQTYCNFSWPPPGIQPEGMFFRAIMQDSLNASVWETGCVAPDEDSDFECEVQFAALPSATWEYLKAGRGDVDLYGGYSNPWVECYPVTCPSATVTEAVLVIQADFPVSIGDESWGAIKALFK
jgi:hypothetical protein